MKYLKQIAVGTVGLLLAVGCQNEEWNFSDFKYTSVYFPNQTPVRTIIQGEADGYDVTLDHKRQFQIGVSMGGVYENKINRAVGFELAPELAAGIRETESGELLEVLPEEYYTLSNTEQFVIPAGREDGRITVQLHDAFFDDPNACKTHYVIPLRITSARVDSILTGVPAVSGASPDPRFKDGWTKTPQNYTLFGIKFQNKYHGKYFFRGRSVVRDIDNDSIVGVAVVHNDYMEKNEQFTISTVGRYSVFLSKEWSLRAVENAVNNPHLYPGMADAKKVNVTVTFDPESEEGIITGDCNIRGTAKWVSKKTSGESWGNKKRDAIFLSYTAEIPSAYLKYEVKDTLTFMSNMVSFELFTPELVP